DSPSAVRFPPIPSTRSAAGSQSVRGSPIGSRRQGMTMDQPKTPAHISQVAMVVHDLDASMKMLHETLGWGPWNVYEHVPPKLHHTHLRGQPVDFSMLGAECEVQPGLVFELVQPLDGPSIYKEHLEKYGEGVQHIACMMHSQADS